MTGPEEDSTQGVAARSPCLVDGCSCKDPRIISTRRAAFYAAQARANGETAARVIPAEAGWQLPTDRSS